MSVRPRGVLRWAERLGALLVIGFLGAYLVRNGAEVAAHPWRIEWLRLLLGTVCVLAAYSGFVLSWRRIISRFGGPLSVLDGHRIWYLGNLGRYVPGKVLQLAGTAYLARAKGVSPVLTVSASLTSQAFVLASARAFRALCIRWASAAPACRGRVPGGSRSAPRDRRDGPAAAEWSRRRSVATFFRRANRAFARAGGSLRRRS